MFDVGRSSFKTTLFIVPYAMSHPRPELGSKAEPCALILGVLFVSDKIVSLYRARLAREKGTVRKDWGGRISIALAYPNLYPIGMSNLGFQVVYHLLLRR